MIARLTGKSEPARRDTRSGGSSAPLLPANLSGALALRRDGEYALLDADGRLHALDQPKIRGAVDVALRLGQSCASEKVT